MGDEHEAIHQVVELALRADDGDEEAAVELNDVARSVSASVLFAARDRTALVARHVIPIGQPPSSLQPASELRHGFVESMTTAGAGDDLPAGSIRD